VHSPTHGRAFAVSVFLNVGFVIVEVIYGLLAGSVALVADAAHNLGDVGGLLIAWAATRLARIEPTHRRTYGWRKSTVLAAWVNALLLFSAVGAVTWEAVGRFGSPAEIDGWTMIVVAAIGVVVNAVSAGMFFAGRERDANIRGAFLHLAADAGVSVGVVVAGSIILVTGWHWVDPVTSLAISVVIVVTTWGLLRESTNMVLDAVPDHIDLDRLRELVLALPGVEDVHDLHVWPMSTSETAMTAHVGVCEGTQPQMLLPAIERLMHDEFEIGHCTVQLEPPRVSGDCGQGRAGRL
jgi:cobalt-zinc-cadmium efflux system protein